MLPPDPKTDPTPEEPDAHVVVFDEETFNHEDDVETSRSVSQGDGDGQRVRAQKALRLWQRFIEGP
jgi:hypothetical protein